MSPEPRFIHEQPNSENTIPVDLYRASSPEKFSLEDDDKFVLYGGGANYGLSFIQNPQQELKVANEFSQLSYDNISVFILNTGVIIWFNQNNIGLELPYQTISLHAVKPPTNEDVCKLYLQILSNKLISSIPKMESQFITTTEIEITENSQGNTHPLFKLQSNIEQLYTAMSTCAQFHLDSDSDEEDNINSFASEADQTPALEIPSGWLTNGDAEEDFILPNTGNADDLEFDENHSHDPSDNVAGMYVDVGYASIAGSIRKRENDVETIVKNRRIH